MVINLCESKQEKTDYMEMALKEVEKLDNVIGSFAKKNNFNATFEYDDDSTYLSFYADERVPGFKQYELPEIAIDLLNKITKKSKSGIIIQPNDKTSIEIFLCKSPRCIDTEESYTNICDYCDFIKSLLD